MTPQQTPPLYGETMMSKSLGEKLCRAFEQSGEATTPWSEATDAARSLYERVGLKFCASLSNDETATATIEALRDSVEGLTCDLRLAVETAYHRGATEWTRLNYPRIYAALNPQQEGSRDHG